MPPLIRKVMIIGFDPQTCEDQAVKYLFRMGFAHDLFLAIKSNYLTSDPFPLDCIFIGGMCHIKPLKTPADLEKMMLHGRDLCWSGVRHNQEFLNALFLRLKCQDHIFTIQKGGIVRHPEHGLMKYTGEKHLGMTGSALNKYIFMKPDDYATLVAVEDLEVLTAPEDWEVSEFEMPPKAGER